MGDIAGEPYAGEDLCRRLDGVIDLKTQLEVAGGDVKCHVVRDASDGTAVRAGPTMPA